MVNVEGFGSGDPSSDPGRDVTFFHSPSIIFAATVFSIAGPDAGATARETITFTELRVGKRAFRCWQ
jgi:hypothetical protein